MVESELLLRLSSLPRSGRGEQQGDERQQLLLLLLLLQQQPPKKKKGTGGRGADMREVRREKEK